MEEPTLTLSELLAEAAAAAGLGDRVEAERLYRRATNRSPGNSQAWLGLAAAVESNGRKTRLLRESAGYQSGQRGGQGRAATAGGPRHE